MATVPASLPQVSARFLTSFFDIAPEILIEFAIDVVVNQESSFCCGVGIDRLASKLRCWVF